MTNGQLAAKRMEGGWAEESSSIQGSTAGSALAFTG